MKARLIAGILAMAAAVALVGWGLSPGGSHNRSRPSAASTPQVTASSSPTSSPTRWRLKFASDFSGRKLNRKIWGNCYPWTRGASGCTNFSNREYEWYVPSQARVSGGVLDLVAQRISTPGLNAKGGPKTYACRSGMVTTYPGFQFKYGYVQVVAKIPLSKGLWPALWLAAANLKWPPEIDLLEHWGRKQQVGVYLHPVGASTVIHHVNMTNLAGHWHTYSLVWTRSYLIWRIDGHTVLTIRQHIPHQPMYFIANLAEFSPPRGSRCDGTMRIRSVKVWQQR